MGAFSQWYTFSEHKLISIYWAGFLRGLILSKLLCEKPKKSYPVSDKSSSDLIKIASKVSLKKPWTRESSEI